LSDACAAERLEYSTWLPSSTLMASEKWPTASSNRPAENAALPFACGPYVTPHAHPPPCQTTEPCDPVYDGAAGEAR
jgi:hypothetical protein